MCQLRDYDNLSLMREYRDWLVGELPMWHRSYLPIPTQGTIFDFGAGCGETAQFYRLHGAERVVSVEMNPEACQLFQKNFPEAHVVPEDSKIVLLPARVSHIKIDIEGAERNLRLETHQFNPKLKLLEWFGSNVNFWELGESHIPIMRTLPHVWAKKALVWQGRKRREIMNRIWDWDT